MLRNRFIYAILFGFFLSKYSELIITLDIVNTSDLPNHMATMANETSNTTVGLSHTVASTNSDLIISSDSDCDKIEENTWKSITVNAGLCNSMIGDLNISNYTNLQSITIKASTTLQQMTLSNLNSLTISNNPNLKSFVVEDGNYQNGYGNFGGFINVKNVILKGMSMSE